ncbi:6-bladed beta-propeller [Parabacteroides pacaensis]|uniref:6-bladed beta-propeller n=1 Tax=Parabacteroides pacaensis TaxID=2086575 RepID=UPI000D10122E|nr:6-bladed beta-propeller [Parabacteroides pacaensis]
MNKCIFIIFITTIFLLSCKKESKNRTDFIFIPKNQISNIEEISFNDDRFIDSCVFILLESSDEALIGNISQLEIYKDRYYILDNMRNQLKVFDSKGKFLFDIGNKGMGSGEYNMINAFVINEEENKICLFDPALLAVHEYKLEGDFIQTVKHKEDRLNIIRDVVCKDNYIYCCLGQCYFNDKMYVVLSAKDYSIMDEWGTYPVKLYEQVGIISSQHPFSYSKGDLHHISLYSDTIYSYKNGKIAPYLLIETGKPNIPSDYFIGKPFENDPQEAYYHMMVNKKYSPGFSTFFETDRYILTRFYLNKNFYLIDKDKMETFHIENKMFPQFGHISVMDKNKLVEIFLQDNIAFYKNEVESEHLECPEQLREIMADYDAEEDNPILIVYYMKRSTK